jgi:ADP-ribosylglycohydrolase
VIYSFLPPATPQQRAWLSLEGLSIGDSFGELHTGEAPAIRLRVAERTYGSVPPPWPWTDDTAMALSIVETLERHGRISQSNLASAFAKQYAADPKRGYGAGAHRVLSAMCEGQQWSVAARSVFNGEGSAGNGAAMRAAPIGAYFSGDPMSAAREAKLSAQVTHAHKSAQHGAVAIAVAASMVFSGERDPQRLLTEIRQCVPHGELRICLDQLPKLMADGSDKFRVAKTVGNGSNVLAVDTVPFAIWCALRYLDNYEKALWACCDVGGDVDTLCAMVGGIVVGAVGFAAIPERWRDSREPLPKVASVGSWVIAPAGCRGY